MMELPDCVRYGNARADDGKREFHGLDYVPHVAKLARVRRTSGAAWRIVLFLFALGLAIRIIFGNRLDSTPFAPFVPALPVAALICGWRKSVILLGASAAVCCLIPASASTGFVLTPSFGFRIVVFILVGGFLIALIEALAETVQRLDSAARLNADLFRELQHRVSNNFQIVAATLQKARRNISEPVAVDAIDNAIFRIDSLGRLHRRLYDPNSYRDGLEPILRDVLEETFQGVTAQVRIDIDSETLTVGQMTTIVLLVNEAAINAAKHVFRPERGGKFEVTLRANGYENLLTVKDDGPGFKTPEGKATTQYGLAVMRGLAAQLGGTLEISHVAGATILVAFNAPQR